MQRRTAVAAAAAISMSLLSGFAAIGAHLGALGFAAPSPTPAVSAPAAGAPATLTPAVAATARHDYAREHRAPATTAAQSSTPTGARDD